MSLILHIEAVQKNINSACPCRYC